MFIRIKVSWICQVIKEIKKQEENIGFPVAGVHPEDVPKDTDIE